MITASTTCYLFARTLRRENSDLARLATIECGNRPLGVVGQCVVREVCQPLPGTCLAGLPVLGKRSIPAYRGQEPQIVMTTPLLEGLDGVQKMSKSLGNYVGITEAPGEMFGKIMSISDDLMWRYFEVLSFRPLGEIEALMSLAAYAFERPEDPDPEIVEGGPADDLVVSPAHPYTRALLSSIADVGELGTEPRQVDADPSQEVTGGCPFAPRCDRARPGYNCLKWHR